MRYRLPFCSIEEVEEAIAELTRDIDRVCLVNPVTPEAEVNRKVRFVVLKRERDDLREQLAEMTLVLATCEPAGRAAA